jgi:hypothetical protein
VTVEAVVMTRSHPQLQPQVDGKGYGRLTEDDGVLA